MMVAVVASLRHAAEECLVAADRLQTESTDENINYIGSSYYSIQYGLQISRKLSTMGTLISELFFMLLTCKRQ